MPSSFIVTDLGFGDSGKGALVDALARRYGVDWVVRYNGGSQAAHNVVTPTGAHHRFSQFGSALLANPTAGTYLSKYVLVDPITLRDEYHVLRAKGILPLFYVDPDCVIITPYHVAANCVREHARGSLRYGTCGMGVGEARSDSLHGFPTIHARDLRGSVSKITEMLREVWLNKHTQLSEELLNPLQDDIVDFLTPKGEETIPEVARLFSSFGSLFVEDVRDQLRGNLVFEGAQGVLLDEDFGFFPHTTWTKCTAYNAKCLATELGILQDTEVIGVLRAYHTRHGAGTFPTEDPDTLPWATRGDHNVHNAWQGDFRTGHFDLTLAKYAAMCNGGMDQLVLTCLDRLPPNPKAGHYKQILGPPKFANEGEMIVQQARLGAKLAWARPEYEVFASPEALVEVIRDELGVQDGWETWSPSYIAT